MDNEISDLSAEQIPALTAIITNGANDHVIASEITEATTASSAASAQLTTNLTWESNIDLGPGVADLSTPTLTARQTADLTPRQAFIPTRNAQILVTLSTRVTPLNLYGSRFFWISRRARLTDGTLTQVVRFTGAIASNTAKIATNTAAIATLTALLAAQ